MRPRAANPATPPRQPSWPAACWRPPSTPPPKKPDSGGPWPARSLADHYAVKPGTLGSGQLLHGTYSKKSPYNTCTPEGVDECTSWGDYFYMEALTRLTKDWEMYW